MFVIMAGPLGIANREDPDQTAFQILICTFCKGIYAGKRISKFQRKLTKVSFVGLKTSNSTGAFIRINTGLQVHVYQITIDR